MLAQSSADGHWSAVLDQIQQSLARTLTEVEDREQSFNFAAVVAPPLNDHEPLTGQAAGTCVPGVSDEGGVQRQAAEVEEQLKAAENALRVWLERAAAVRSTLAKDANSGV